MSLDRLPLPGETLLGTDFRINGGGKGANQAVACARLGAQVTFVGAVGDDDAGRNARAGFNAAGIDERPLYTDKSQPTGAASILTGADGANVIGVAPGANATLTPERVLEQETVIAAADMLLLQLEVPIASVDQAISLAVKHGTRVILNPAPAAAIPRKWYSSIEFLVPNETEAGSLSDMHVVDRSSALTASRNLVEQGTDTVITTLGGDGVLVLTKDSSQHFPAPAASVVDTVAAGDTFVAGFAVATLEGSDLAAAIHFAQQAAAITISRHGAIDALPFRSELTPD